MQARVYEYLKDKPKVELLIVRDEKEASSYRDVASFLNYRVYKLPDFRANIGDDLRSFKEELFEILSTLQKFYSDKKQNKLLISPIRTVMNPLPKKEILQFFDISFADTLDIKELKTKLYNWGYSFVDIIEEEGEVSFRGDIIDIYPISSPSPFRISLFDDEVEEIRAFSPHTQKSIDKELESIKVIPAYFSLSSDEFEMISNRVDELQSDSFIKDISSLGFWCLEDLATDFVENYNSILSSSMVSDIEEIFSFIENPTKKEQFLKLPIVDEAEVYKDIEAININDFLNYHQNKKIKIIASNEAIYKQHSIDPDIKFKMINEDYILNVMSDEELIISLNRPKRKKRLKKSSIILDELKIGDYIVHENYGIGVFKGLTNTTVLGAVRDFVEISYQNDDKLLIPVENLNVIDRYIGEGGLASVDKLGKGTFLKLKEKTKAKLFEIAKDIIEIAAKRELTNAPIIRSNFDELSLFQNEAGFVYTQDQTRSINEIFEDLAKGQVMDRLLSGDVGFGKTEVAMNAIFATIKSGFNTAFIAPTTLLVSQHYRSLKERFDSYGFKIAKLDRFTSAKEKKNILKSMKEGTLDLCIGTHALLGVEFKNLALLIIDEEHKFGVKQKEKLKNLRENMHMLSMSATPIPRSLNMALSSLKQYSQLLTPPSEREDVRTFVKVYDEKSIKEVVLREKRRGGQIFFVHNRIASIEDKKRELQDILPNIKILVLHSKIPPSTTEKEIAKFENGEYDLLLSTSIVESGIHIPNVNTIIIESADRFGIADLHQLRGRVGRSKRQGYCYYLVKDKDDLSEQSQKRLIALESNSFLGSGSVLAYHDLEIRGGGNLVGEAQSGHIKGIGYSLYLKMLEDAINILMNKTQSEQKEVEIKLSISAYLSSELVGEDRIRLELYRRLSKCQNTKEVYEIEEEIIDRFGELDTPTKQFLEIIIIKILALEKGIKSISSYQQNITIVYPDEKKEYLKSRSKDDDDLIAMTMGFLKG